MDRAHTVEVELPLAKRANVRRLFPLLNSQNVISSSLLLARPAGSNSAICIYPRISPVLGALERVRSVGVRNFTWRPVFSQCSILSKALTMSATDTAYADIYKAHTQLPVC